MIFLNIPVKEDNLYVQIIPVLVKEVFEEVRHRLICDVATHNNVPETLNGSTGFVYLNLISPASLFIALLTLSRYSSILYSLYRRSLGCFSFLQEMEI